MWKVVFSTKEMIVAKKSPAIYFCGFNIVFEKTQKLWLAIVFFPEKMVVAYIDFPEIKKGLPTAV